MAFFFCATVCNQGSFCLSQCLTSRDCQRNSCLKTKLLAISMYLSQRNNQSQNGSCLRKFPEALSIRYENNINVQQPGISKKDYEISII